MDKNSLKKILEKQPQGAIERYRLEKALSDRYGPEGIKVYFAIDGKTPAEDLMKKLNMNEEKFIEVINYMESTNMLKIEAPVVSQHEAKSEPPPQPKEEISEIPLIKTNDLGERTDKGSALQALIMKEKPNEEKVEMKQAEKPQTVEAKVPLRFTRIPKTPTEKKLYDKFGDMGLYVFSLIDEAKSPKDILKETSMSEEQLRAILEFMSNEKIIKLEKPQEAMEKPIVKAPQPAPVQQPPKPTAPAPTKPIVAAPPAKPIAAPQLQKPAEKPMPRLVQRVTLNRNEIYVPTVPPLKLLTKLRIEAELLRVYGNDGVKSFSLMNGKKTNVKIMKDIKIHPAKLDDIMAFLLEKDALKLQPLVAENIKELYGEEGFSIYSKYGRDGILLYELIDKKASLKDIVKMSGIEPKLAIEMFAFIHKVLGLEIPLDTDLLYKQLGIKQQK